MKQLGLTPKRPYSLKAKLHKALHIKELGDIADVEALTEWSQARIPEQDKLLHHIYTKRVDCYKKGEVLLDAGYDMMRDAIRQNNQVIESILLNS